MAKGTTFTHDAAVDRARAAVKKVSHERARWAFLRSFSRDRERLRGRALLAAWVVARHLPKHAFKPTKLFSTKTTCGVCRYGETHDAKMALDFDEVDDVMDDEGAVLFMEEPAPMAYVLETAASLGDEEPQAGEVKVVSTIIDRLRDVVAAAKKVNNPKKPFRKEALDAIGKAYRSNKYERSWILETLGYCGILRVPSRKAFWREFVPLDERPEAPERNNELAYPTRFWHAKDGIDDARLTVVFPELA